MENFSLYLKNNIPFNYLKTYYNADDAGMIYGISKMEIKHSNFIKWLLSPKGEDVINYYPIKKLLKILQKNNEYNCYNNFMNIDLNNATLTKIDIKKEKRFVNSNIEMIDLFITLKINNKNYVIVIENKIEASEGDEQLLKYKNAVNTSLKDCEKLFVLLHPNYEQLKIIDSKEKLKKSMKENEYISLTYQDIYEVANGYMNIVNNNEISLIIKNYIHILSCYESTKMNGLIIETVERKYLEELFSDKNIIDFLQNNSLNSEYKKAYEEYKDLFQKLFNKYQLLKEFNEDDSIVKLINKKNKRRLYMFYDVKYTSGAKLTYEILKSISEKINSISELGEELKDRLFATDAYLYENYNAQIWGGMIEKPIIIGNKEYFCTNYVSYSALEEFKDLVVNRFPEYADKIIID